MSLEFSLAENPFNKDATFGSKYRNRLDFDEYDRLRESRHLRESQDSIRAQLIEKDFRMHMNLEKELGEKSREELLQAHQKNMDDLDKLFHNLQMSLNGTG